MHIPSAIAVFQSQNYKDFTFITGNRPLNDLKIRKIIKEIESGNDMLQYYPIQVRVNGDTMTILDGQHRYFISKKLKRPVYYILVNEEKSMPEIAKVNSNVEKWKSKDFINCFVAADNTHYQTVQKFIEDYGFSTGISLILLAKGNPGDSTGSSSGLLESFYAGTYEVQCQEEAVKVAEQVKRFSFFKNWRSRVFVLSIYRLMTSNKYPFDDIVEAVTKHKEMLTEKATFKDYINNIEQIVNIGKKNRIIIY